MWKSKKKAVSFASLLSEAYSHSTSISFSTSENNNEQMIVEVSHKSIEGNNVCFKYIEKRRKDEKRIKIAFSLFFQLVEHFGIFDIDNSWYKVIWFLENGEKTSVLPPEINRIILSYLPKKNQGCFSSSFWKHLKRLGEEACNFSKEKESEVKTLKEIAIQLESIENYFSKVSLDWYCMNMLTIFAAEKKVNLDSHHISKCIKYMKKNKEIKKERVELKKKKQFVAIFGKCKGKAIGGFIGKNGYTSKIVNKKFEVFYNVDAKKQSEEAKITLAGSIEEVEKAIQYLSSKQVVYSIDSSDHSKITNKTHSQSINFVGFHPQVLCELKKEISKKLKLKLKVFGRFGFLEEDDWQKIQKILKFLKDGMQTVSYLKYSKDFNSNKFKAKPDLRTIINHVGMYVHGFQYIEQSWKTTE